MSYAEFVQLVRQMREAQRAYFKSRLVGDLQISKRLERQVDEAVKRFMGETPDLQPLLPGVK